MKQLILVQIVCAILCAFAGFQAGWYFKPVLPLPRYVMIDGIAYKVVLTEHPNWSTIEQFICGPDNCKAVQ